MNEPAKILSRIEELGGYMVPDDNGNIDYRVPKHCVEAVALLQVAKTEKRAILACLLTRELSRSVSECPDGVRILNWELKEPPVYIEISSAVMDPDLFARSTLRQLGVALSNPKRWVGWTVLQLIERLKQVGVNVVVDDD